MKLARLLLAAPIAAFSAAVALAHPASDAGGLPLALHGHPHVEGPGLLLTLVAIAAVGITAWLYFRRREAQRGRK